jgi:microcystin-dependent protein
MSDQFLGEIRIFAGPYEPRNWAICDGRLLNISEYAALYALVGTTYGGNGVDKFGIPDFRGRLPLSQGRGPGLSQRSLNEAGGSETVALLPFNLPSHGHAAMASTNAATTTTAGPTVVLAEVKDKIANQTDARYLPAAKPAGASETLGAQQVSLTGGSQGHPNVMPSIAINYIIALQGIFPSSV